MDPDPPVVSRTTAGALAVGAPAPATTGVPDMPRPGPRRPNTTLRIEDELGDRIDERAIAEGLVKAKDGTANRSEMIRILAAYALETMPKGWRPQ
jgi:hypothetical protein